VEPGSVAERFLRQTSPHALLAQVAGELLVRLHGHDPAERTTEPLQTTPLKPCRSPADIEPQMSTTLLYWIVLLNGVWALCCVLLFPGKGRNPLGGLLLGLLLKGFRIPMVRAS